MNKFDPELHLLADRYRARVEAKQLRSAVDLPALPQRVTIEVEFRGDVRDLEAIGFVVETYVANPVENYKIASGTIPVASLEALAKIDHVVGAGPPTQLYPLLNNSAEEIHARVVQKRNPVGATGKNVVIGLIDSGIEIRHGAFIDDTGKTRILELWDQRDPKANQDDGNHDDETRGQPGPNNRGLVYNRDTIQKILDRRETPRSMPRSPHGTMVAGIAAGDGSPANFWACASWRSRRAGRPVP
jgi:subtilisin family serine protease